MQLPLFKEESSYTLFSDLLFKSCECSREKDNTCFQNNLGETGHVVKCILKYENTIGKKANVGNHSRRSSMIIIL